MSLSFCIEGPGRMFSGYGAMGTRTPNHLNAIEVLYQLSYGPNLPFWRKVALLQTLPWG
jgi:hypothetical protein